MNETLISKQTKDETTDCNEWNVGDKFTTTETGKLIFTVSKVSKFDVEAADSRSCADYTVFSKSLIVKVAGVKPYTYRHYSKPKVNDLKGQAINLLTSIWEYMDNKADDEGDSEHLRPNEEMWFKTQIDELLEKLK